jgi:hypothetical protein
VQVGLGRVLFWIYDLLFRLQARSTSATLMVEVLNGSDTHLTSLTLLLLDVLVRMLNAECWRLKQSANYGLLLVSKFELSVQYLFVPHNWLLIRCSTWVRFHPSFAVSGEKSVQLDTRACGDRLAWVSTFILHMHASRIVRKKSRVEGMSGPQQCSLTLLSFADWAWSLLESLTNVSARKLRQRIESRECRDREVRVSSFNFSISNARGRCRERSDYVLQCSLKYLDSSVIGPIPMVFTALISLKLELVSGSFALTKDRVLIPNKSFNENVGLYCQTIETLEQVRSICPYKRTRLMQWTRF